MKLWYEGFDTFGIMPHEYRKSIIRNTEEADIESESYFTGVDYTIQEKKK